MPGAIARLYMTGASRTSGLGSPKFDSQNEKLGKQDNFFLSLKLKTYLTLFHVPHKIMIMIIVIFVGHSGNRPRNWDSFSLPSACAIYISMHNED
jgi:hypothetical protein